VRIPDHADNRPSHRQISNSDTGSLIGICIVWFFTEGAARGKSIQTDSRTIMPLGRSRINSLRAFSSEADTGSREENASNQNHGPAMLADRTMAPRGL
jgi:hypothetical protein